LLSRKNEVYSFGGGSFGQLGLGTLSSMPLDSDGAPYMPIPKKVSTIIKFID
jgi:alpha-tubulin suppressor-like RCC1 family protein